MYSDEVNDDKRCCIDGLYTYRCQGTLVNYINYVVKRYCVFNGVEVILEFDLDFYSKVFRQRWARYSFRQTEDILRDEIEGKFMFPVFRE